MKHTSHQASTESIEAARIAASAIAAKNGEDIVLLDLSNLLVVTDVFLVASGTSTRHVKTLVDDAAVALRDAGRKPIRREGVDHGEWVLLDYGDVVIHVFDRETRSYYELERLWADAPAIEFEPSSSYADS
ncbi:MAG: ribosome silencing factor [Acidimicrobiia bacterium]